MSVDHIIYISVIIAVLETVHAAREQLHHFGLYLTAA